MNSKSWSLYSCDVSQSPVVSQSSCIQVPGKYSGRHVTLMRLQVSRHWPVSKSFRINLFTGCICWMAHGRFPFGWKGVWGGQPVCRPQWWRCPTCSKDDVCFCSSLQISHCWHCYGVLSLQFYRKPPPPAMGVVTPYELLMTLHVSSLWCSVW